MKMNYLIGRKGLLLNPLAILLLALVSFLVSCGDDDGDDTGTDVDPPQAFFSFTASESTVTFIDASIDATEWSWDFDDGNTSTEQNPEHTYSEPGEYEVTLVVTNSAGSDEVTEIVATQNGGALASKIVGKTWIPAHGQVPAYALGPVDDGTGNGIVFETWNDASGYWFNWGDIGTHQWLAQRPSLANDEYVFNIDGTYTVNFNGDFWAEYALWSETEFDETDITIGTSAPLLPANSDGVDMSDFAAGSWNFVVDEDNALITVSGSGAHILNPRIVGVDIESVADHVVTPQDESQYEIVRVVEADVADTLVLVAYANDGANNLAQFIIMHSYHNEADIPDLEEVPCTILRKEETVDAVDFAHTFESEDGGTGMASLNEDYTFTFGVTQDEELCTMVEIQNDAAAYGNIMMRAGASGECADGTEYYVEDIVFDSTNPEYIVQFDIFIPTEGNDFTTDLVDELTVRWVDESQHGGDFWQYYVYQVKTGVAMDEWVTVTYDFEDGTALFGIQGDDATAKTLSEAIEDGTNVPDALHIDWGGDGHTAAGVFYIKNFQLIDSVVE